jgi:hypothetical protein
LEPSARGQELRDWKTEAPFQIGVGGRFRESGAIPQWWDGLMKRSSMVALVISGALLTGCDSSNESSWEDSQTYTNNHYVAGRGYYHAPYHAWYPFPYNYYDPARRTYYHGGSYSTAPHVSNVTSSRPIVRSSRSSSRSSSVVRGGFSSSRSSVS